MTAPGSEPVGSLIVATFSSLIVARHRPIQRIANAEGATASQVHRSALEYGLSELRKALQRGRHPGVPTAAGESEVAAAP